jgi:hypothetical protein
VEEALFDSAEQKFAPAFDKKLVCPSNHKQVYTTMRLHVLSADFKDRNKELKGIVLSVEDIHGAAYLHEKMAVYHTAPFPLDAAIKDTASVKVEIQQEAHKRQGGGPGGAGSRGYEGTGGGSSGASSSSTRIHSSVNETQVALLHYVWFTRVCLCMRYR